MVDTAQAIEPAIRIGAYGTNAAAGFALAGVFGLLMGLACALGLYLAWWSNKPMRDYYQRRLGDEGRRSIRTPRGGRVETRGGHLTDGRPCWCNPKRTDYSREEDRR